MERLKPVANAMSDAWAKFAHNGNPGIPVWHPYTKENGELFVFGGTLPHTLHNHDRKLEEIINRHCFKQLDEFRATHADKSAGQKEFLQQSNTQIGN